MEAAEKPKGKARWDKLLAAGALALGAKVISDHGDKINEPWFMPDAGAQAEEEPEGDQGKVPGLPEDAEINFNAPEGGPDMGGEDASVDDIEEEPGEPVPEDKRMVKR